MLVLDILISAGSFKCFPCTPRFHFAKSIFADRLGSSHPRFDSSDVFMPFLIIVGLNQMIADEV
jgi:hypothetical protein